MHALAQWARQPWLEAVAVRRLAVWIVHLALWSAANACAYLLRFDLDVVEAARHFQPRWLLAACVARTLAGACGGSFSGLWRYAGVHDVYAILGSTLAASVGLCLAAALTPGGPPRSIWPIDFLACLLLTGALRLGARAALRLSRRARLAAPRRRLLVVGAGDAGEQLLRALAAHRGAGFVAAGVLDDDPRKRGARLHGVRVLGSIDEAARLAPAVAADEIVIALPSADGALMRRIFAATGRAGLPVRTLPGLAERIAGPVGLGELRDVAVEDLLGRAPVHIDAAAVGALVRGRTVLVTGAGGSIGAELCVQVAALAPRRLVMVEQAEQPLFALEGRLAACAAAPPRRGYIGSVCDARRMRTIFLHERPDIVLHAAAHKHVALMERNPGAAIRNNALGTQVVADLAEAGGCAHFVLISTDKAVNPSSVMGASKRIAELYVQALAAGSRTHFSIVRFGNVLGSQGSVVPIFRAQIAAGGPLTITHRDAERYFMTPDEACKLVLQAAALGRGGALFVLDMGEPVRIATLARAMLVLCGRAPGHDIAIDEIGLRPGEKLTEELQLEGETFEPTAHPKIARARAVPRALGAMRAALAELDGLCEQVVSLPQLEQVLRRIVPEYCRSAGEPSLDVMRPVALYR